MQYAIGDIVNGLFELLGGVVLFQNCRRLYRDKEIKGIDWRVTAFFMTWGYWNLYYYPSLDQWASFLGGLVIVSANTLWVSMALYYMNKDKDANLS